MKVIAKICAFVLPFLLLVNIFRAVLVYQAESITGMNYLLHKYSGENYIWYVSPVGISDLIQHFSSYNAFPNIQHGIFVFRALGNGLVERCMDGYQFSDILEILGILVAVVPNTFAMFVYAIGDIISNIWFFFTFITGAGDWSFVILY